MDVTSVQALTMEVNLFATVLGVPVPIPYSTLRAILVEAFEYSSEEFGMRAAREWAAGYTFPQHLLHRDLKEFTSAHHNLAALCLQRQTALRDGRIST
jgi:hypothetical protein